MAYNLTGCTTNEKQGAIHDDDSIGALLRHDQYRHIRRRADHRRSRTPVRAIVETWRLGTPPEEIPTAFPHLTLAQVFGALSYYSDNQNEINEYIETNRVPDELIDPLVRHK